MCTGGSPSSSYTPQVAKVTQAAKSPTSTSLQGSADATQQVGTLLTGSTGASAAEVGKLGKNTLLGS